MLSCEEKIIILRDMIQNNNKYFKPEWVMRIMSLFPYTIHKVDLEYFITHLTIKGCVKEHEYYLDINYIECNNLVNKILYKVDNIK